MTILTMKKKKLIERLIFYVCPYNYILLLIAWIRLSWGTKFEWWCIVYLMRGGTREERQRWYLYGMSLYISRS